METPVMQTAAQCLMLQCSAEQRTALLKAKFHYTGPTEPARTRTDFVGDPHGPNGVSRRPGPQKKFVRVRSGPCSGI